MVKLIGLILMILGWILLAKARGGLILSTIGIALLTL